MPAMGPLSNGLSPRVRGNHFVSVLKTVLGRSIPACAGEPPVRRASADMTSVYPRVCGGTQGLAEAEKGAEGLSPRVRGNLDVLDVLDARVRSIPACAGEPAATAFQVMMMRVYPRVCGGTCVLARRGARPSGLSPRVRGNRSPDDVLRVIRRSIPACAGEPTWWMPSSPRSRVYPRVCGGTGFKSSSNSMSPGLSPRVRGNRANNPDILQGVGSIPACAGEPADPAAAISDDQVYPRVCGGTRGRVLRCKGVRGLSPRVRGNLRRLLVHGLPVGSIPACAGEPWTSR